MTKRGFPPTVVYDQVRVLRTQGMTYQAIGEQVGLSRERVRQILNKYGEAGRHLCACGQAMHYPTAEQCPRCRRAAEKAARPKPVVRVGLFTCRRCGQGFALSGMALTKQIVNIRNQHLTRAECPHCRLLRQHGPIETACARCGAPLTISGPSAHAARWRQRRGETVRFFCHPSCFPRACVICGRGGRIRRGYCDAHYDRWRIHGDPMAAVRQYRRKEESNATREPQ